MAVQSYSLEEIHRWDDQSVTVLYREFYQALVGYARQITNDVAAAEDITQEVLLNAWRRKITFKSPGALKVYLFNAVRNESIDHLRHLAVRQDSITNVQQMYREMQTDDSGEARLHKEEVYRQLFQAIDALPSRQREVFLLTIEGKKNHEIAEAMGVAVLSVNKLRQRGLKTLRDMLSPEAFALLLTLIQ